MSPMAASALRRAALATGALAVTLAGHIVTTGEAHVLPVAPFLWLCAIGVVVAPAGAARRRRRFRRHGFARLLAAQLGAQAVVHLTLHAAPWTLGMGLHHAGAPLVTPAAAILHLTLALLLTVALAAGERALARAVAAVRAVLGGAAPRAAAARPPEVVAPVVLLAPPSWRRRPRPARGPPAGVPPQAVLLRAPAPAPA